MAKEKRGYADLGAILLHEKMMKTTKLYSRFMTFFLLLLFGFAIGAKSSGLDTYRFAILMSVIGLIAVLHFRMMRKKFSRYQSSKN